MNETLAEKIQLRLSERSKLLSYANETELESLQMMFEHLAYLGKVLHTAREYLDMPHVRRNADGKDYFDCDTLWLWERGLALPSEVESGAISEMVQWYVQEIRRQRGDMTILTVQQDIHILLNVLCGTTPPFPQTIL